MREQQPFAIRSMRIKLGNEYTGFEALQVDRAFSGIFPQ